MRLDRRLFLAAALFTGLLGRIPVGAAEPHLTTTSGTVTSFGQQTGILNVNTRLGPKTFLVTEDTIVTLNDRATGTASLTAGAQVELDYRFDTSEAFFIRIIRETRLRGRVVSVAANSVVFRLEGGGQMTFTTDALTELRLGGILLSDRNVLVGRRASAIVQTATGTGGGNALLLRLAGEASELRGEISTVDAGTSTLVVGGKRNTRTVTLAPTATVRLNGAVTTLSTLQPTDRVHVAYVRSGATLQALAVQAFR